ncbi:E1 DerP2 DerF2 domain containing protein [Asbolus verrucosus]|uniref:E1 DerP2 DerF2 domain containing protein n=1 Tax=Asbolus verrucosus TaxID=1661398 RepID=A0A482W5N4_ASBVE|nr:E1 DerP2 DerF2 domain containing protein [Asbolus verrucosus]
MLKLLICSYTIFFVIAYINAEVIAFENCEDSDDSICEVKEVRVEPCKEAKSKKPCKVRSGTNASIEFDYIPHFDSDRMINQAYSATLIDLPLIGMDRDGCKFTQCPVKSGEASTYKNTLYMSPAFPLLNYNVKWRVWDANHDTKGCCFTFKIKLVR